MKKILCATDETEVSRNAEIFAADLALAVKADLCYIHVSPPRKKGAGMEGKWLSAILDEASARDHDILQHSVKVAKSKGIKKAVCVTIRSEKVVSALIEFAEKEGYDHIIVGSTGREGIPRFVVGSIAGGLVHKAHCPVTIVR